MRVPVLVLVGLLTPFAAPVRADAPAAAPATDAASQIKALIAEIDAAMVEKDDAKLSSAAKKAPTLYKSTTDQAVRGPLLKSLVALVKQTKYASARSAALKALIETEDSKEAGKALMAVYPKDDVEDNERFNVAIVNGIGALHPDSAIPTLLETYKKAKQNELAAEAVLALGNYHKSRQRETVLEEIYKIGKNMVPSRAPGKNPSPEVQARWGVMAPAIGKALDMLTGDTVGDPTEWFKRINDAKVLKTLFKD
jgi:hypothetical protein